MAYNILIIDDSSIVRKVLMKTFGMTDIPVGKFFEANNGKEGLEVLEKEWVDIVFLDINMPVMNGMEFMQIVASREELRETPVVVFSTEGSDERISELKNAGIRAYVRKPASPETLVATISSILGGQQQ